MMLQQTRVDTVIPYYERWLQRFPHIDALADAHIDDVLKQWEGLGYYSRARNLHRAAQMVRERHNSSIPAEFHDLKQLPGIGDYTASAVASIAFDRAHAAVDGNVRRVLSRLFDMESPNPVQLQKHADDVLDQARPGDFNQAMMELGATICTPRSPLCEGCPVRMHCAAFRNGTVQLRPAPKVRKPLPTERVNTLIAIHDEHVLVAQRPARGLLAGLWEFPEVLDITDYSSLGVVTHIFTHKRIDYHVHCTSERVGLAGTWIRVSELNTLAFSTAQRRCARLALPDFGS